MRTAASWYVILETRLASAGENNRNRSESDQSMAHVSVCRTLIAQVQEEALRFAAAKIRDLADEMAGEAGSVT